MARWIDPAALRSSTPLVFVDTHAHLDEPDFDNDRDLVIDRAHAADVRWIVNIGYCPDRWESTIALAAARPGIGITLGVHPQHAAEWNAETAHALSERLSTTDAVAIGEIGLDYLRDGPSRECQISSFRDQLAIARSFHLPVVIHQRAAEEDLIAVLKGDAGDLKVVLHSFEGTARLARLACERGYMVGVGGLMTRAKSAPLRDVIRTMPLERLLLETDSPYLVPAGVKARRNEPANIPTIAQRLAELVDCSVEDLAEHTTRNAANCFNR